MNELAHKINDFYRRLGSVCPKYKNIRVTPEDLGDEYVLSEILYDVEDNIYTYEGAAELCHKLRHIKKTHSGIKTIGKVMMIIGIIFMLGTAGASDLDTISLTQTMIQLVISLSVTTLGFIINKKMED